MATDKQPMPSTYPVFAECIPEDIDARRFRVGFVRTPAELEAVQRLRFEVFNLELGEGLEESYETGLDVDRFDAVCHHLIVTEIATGNTIGTYRLQTGAMAREFGGFYSADEFDLAGLPDHVLSEAIETGRACVAKDFRNRHVLFLLWKGLAAYMSWNRKKYLFGCCSLTSQDPIEGKRVMDFLHEQGFVHPSYRVTPQEGWACYSEGFELDPSGQQELEPVKLPKLFGIYMRFGAKVCGEPAIDRFFKTIDYLVLLNLDDLDEQSRGMFFG